MSMAHRGTRRRIDADGVIEERTRGRACTPVLLASGAVIVAALAGIAWLVLQLGGPATGTRRSAPGPTALPRRESVPIGSPSGQTTPLAQGTGSRSGRRPGGQADLGDQATSPGEAMETSKSHGGGLAAFPPLGTKPIQRGIVVPEGFELPPGYVRHYQASDDGRLFAPILRFHPDYHPVDGSGHPIPLPEGRLVPPELAPPGLPIEYLPDPTASTGSAPSP